MNAVCEREQALTPRINEERIARLGLALKNLKSSYDLPVEHIKAAGLYGRMVVMKAGDCVVSRVHKYEHITIALSGSCTVVEVDGTERLVTGPDVWVTKPGTQRALLIHEDTIWMTVHATEEEDVEQMFDRLTCDNFAEFDQFVALLPRMQE